MPLPLEVDEILGCTETGRREDHSHDDRDSQEERDPRSCDQGCQRKPCQQIISRMHGGGEEDASEPVGECLSGLEGHRPVSLGGLPSKVTELLPIIQITTATSQGKQELSPLMTRFRDLLHFPQAAVRSLARLFPGLGTARGSRCAARIMSGCSSLRWTSFR